MLVISILSSAFLYSKQNMKIKIWKVSFQTLSVSRVLKYLFSSHLLNMSDIGGVKNYSIDIGGMRAKYQDRNKVFTENSLVAKEPIAQFKAWFEEASQVPEIIEANAMCLATSSKDGVPSARYVLLKGYGVDGFRFFTNYSSRKGRDLAENPRAALVFYWDVLKRSVRIEGTVEKLQEEESTKYFHSRPKESQLAASASPQSTAVKERASVVSIQDELRAKYSNCDVPKPLEWGGYIVRPNSVEFWQGQSDRLHDRIRFRMPKDGEVVDNVLLHQGEDGWVFERLAP